jgi:hypothetical protein
LGRGVSGDAPRRVVQAASVRNGPLGRALGVDGADQLRERVAHGDRVNVLPAPGDRDALQLVLGLFVLPQDLDDAGGVQLFYLARIMGTSVAQIDATYGHLLPDSEEYLRGLLDDYDARGETAPEAQTSEWR